MVAAISYAQDPSTASPFVIGRKMLASVLALLCKATDRRSSIPVLADLLFTCHDGRQTIRAIDLNNTVRYTAPAGAPFAAVHGVTVNAKLLADTVKSTNADDLILSRSGAGVTIATGSTDAYLMGTNRAHDFPRAPTMPEALPGIDGDLLADMIERALHAVCKDETRFQLNGVLIESRGSVELRVVATDGHRLIRVTHQPSTLAEGFNGTGILPVNGAKILGAILKVANVVNATIANSFLHVSALTADGARWDASLKLVDAQFPPYEQVIPTDYSKLVTVDRKALIAAMKRAKALCTATRGALLKVASGKLTIVAEHPDSGTISEALKAEGSWVESGGTMTLGVNATYLIEALDEITCKHVTLSFGGELDPVEVRGTDDQVNHSVSGSRQIEVIMPMRI